jgi:phosphoribosylpyrophosphate synthetase
MGVMPDVFTSPQSSSKFNEDILNLLSRYYPNGDILIMPNSMRKDPRNVYVDIKAAKEIGLSDEEIAKLQNKVDNMKTDEDIRDFRRKIEILKAEVESMMTHKRGRPSRDITDKKKEIEAYNTLVRANRRRGVDPTYDKKTNTIKPMQIKTLDDRQRRAIDGLFVFNDIDYPSKSFSKNGEDLTYTQSMRLKNKIVLVFDDNLSSGATLDMMCDALKRIGAKMIIPITLGVIPQTAYNPSERANLRN